MTHTPARPATGTTAVWEAREADAEAMIPLIGALARSGGTHVTIYGRPLHTQSVKEILKAHRFARHIDGDELRTSNTLRILEVLRQLEPGAITIDVAQLNRAHRHAGSDSDLRDLVREELAGLPTAFRGQQGRTDVVLYGFGRIGRILARLLTESTSEHGLQLRAVVVRKGSPDDIVKRASLLRRDTIHGPFRGSITVDADTDTIIANGRSIQLIYADHPAAVDYTRYGIRDALLVDNTGRWRDATGLAQHLSAPGIARVLLTAPGKGELKNVVFGINDQSVTPADTIVSAASCTTNAVTPVLKLVNDRFGVVHGHVETVHSFTNDQNLTDNFHSAHRRGRAATLNLVIAETGAAKAVAKALPELAGKLTGNSIRVPTPNVSLAILNLALATTTDKAELNDYLRHMSLHSALRHQIAYTDSPEVVSSDFRGTSHTAIVDGLATISSGTNAVLYVWYDNEHGYSCQVVRLMESMAGVTRPEYPAGQADLP